MITYLIEDLLVLFFRLVDFPVLQPKPIILFYKTSKKY